MTDLDKLLQGDFIPKDNPAQIEALQRSFVEDRPSVVQIDNIQNPATREMIRKWDALFPKKD
jgi:hypothetical protein